MDVGSEIARAAVAALFLDGSSRLLCVKPTYRSGWLVPGGAVEPGESPLAACCREVDEELGLSLEVGRLLCVEYRRAVREEKSSAHFVFWGGQLSHEQVAEIALPPDELSEYEFVETRAAIAKLVPRLARRMGIALCALRDETTLLIEEGGDRVTELAVQETEPWLSRTWQPTAGSGDE